MAAVLTLALGMSANAVMFSVLNTVLLRPLPYPQPDRLVQIWETDARRGDTHNAVSPYNFLDWRSQSQTFEQMATYEYNSVVLTGQKAPARLSALFVTASFFDVLKVSPLKGRTFLPDEDQPANPAWRCWDMERGSAILAAIRRSWASQCCWMTRPIRSSA